MTDDRRERLPLRERVARRIRGIVAAMECDFPESAVQGAIEEVVAGMKLMRCIPDDPDADIYKSYVKTIVDRAVERLFEER